MRRVVLAAGSVFAAVVLVGGGWVAASAFTSPAQWAAQATAPPPAPILADVTQGDLVDERTIGAMVVPSSTSIATLEAVEGAARSIVTASALSTGADVAIGTVLVQVNGQPVFALASPFPLYRDLGVGDAGPDVRVLQENLKSLGLLDRVDGEFGAGTAVAVTALYRSAGVPAPSRAAPTRAAEPSDAGAESDLPTAEPASSVYLPLSAVVAVPELPATLSSAPAVGMDLAAGAAVSFAATTALLRLAVPVELAAVLVPGTDLICTVGAASDIPCRVQAVYDATADAAGAGGGDEVMTWADIVPLETTIGADQADENARIRIHVATLAENALLVPAIAIAQQGTDSGTVLRQGDGSFQNVDVRILAVLNGKAAVSGDLRVGDRLRVDR